jgi:hypothetical protein
VDFAVSSALDRAQRLPALPWSGKPNLFFNGVQHVLRPTNDDEKLLISPNALAEP